jgi:hypothetical protein
MNHWMIWLTSINCIATDINGSYGGIGFKCLCEWHQGGIFVFEDIANPFQRRCFIWFE